MMRSVLAVAGEVLLSLLGIYTLVFIAFAVLPVDPARAVLGPNASVEAVRNLSAQFGLDRPIPVRYLMSLRQMATGDFGDSFYFGGSAGAIVWRLAPITLARTALAIVFGVLIGVFVGRCAAQWAPHAFRNAFMFLQSIPSFCLMLLILWVASGLFSQTPLGAPRLYGVLIIAGAAAYPAGAVGVFVLDRIAPTGASPRHVEFLRMLHFPRWYIVKVLWREALPGVLMIAINAFGVALTAVTFGEFVLGLEGFGVVFIRSCERGDLSVVVAGTLLLSAVVVLVQRGGDLALRWIDPRIRCV